MIFVNGVPQLGGTKITEFTYSGTIVPDAFYIPAARTIIMGCSLSEPQKLSVYVGGQIAIEYTTLSAGLRGHIGAIYCAGSTEKFQNKDGQDRLIRLTGITVS